MRYCRYCGSSVNTNFCPNCGQQVQQLGKEARQPVPDKQQQYVQIPVPEQQIPLKYEITDTSIPLVVVHLKPNQVLYGGKNCVHHMDTSVIVQRGMIEISSFIKNIASEEELFTQYFYTTTPTAKIVFGTNDWCQIKDIDMVPEKELIVEAGAYLFAENTVNREVIVKKGVMSTIKDKKTMAAAAVEVVKDAWIKKSVMPLIKGTGLVQQKFSGTGKLFICALGDFLEFNLKHGESILIQFGSTVAYDAALTTEICNIGLTFFTKLTGPGHIYAQTKPRQAALATEKKR